MDDYHKFKIGMYNSVLQDVAKYELDFFGKQLEDEEREALRQTLKSELRQTYFHAIESFFELFFSLLDRENPNFDDSNILFNLTNSNWQVNYASISKIASGEKSLEFLHNLIEFNGHRISVGHYIFYFGLFDRSRFHPDFFEKVDSSIQSIEYGIKMLASDFVDREEYNSYKHGLRVIPAMKELAVLDLDSSEVKLKWDLSNSMSFYVKTKNKDEVKIKTKLFDTDRDVAMTYFSSNLISSIVYFRKIAFYRDTIKEKQIPIGFFGKEEIEKCAKTNVEIQDLLYTIRRVSK